MIVGVPTETLANESRVALIPAVLPSLTKAGLSIVVETGAGSRAGYSDQEYQAKGATIQDRSGVLRDADIIAQVNTYSNNPVAGQTDLEMLRAGQVIIGLSDPLGATNHVAELAGLGVTAFAMELIPRITRAQSMDALSSMATIAGYKAVLLAAGRLPRMFPLFMTAAGTIKPARVFVIGAGVAGLQAIATAKRLGAVISAYDVRPAVKEQVESVGAKFVELELETANAEDKGGYAKDQGEEFIQRQRALMAKVVVASDVVITTAAIPGRRAPLLITQEMVEAMEPGSVIVDLAAERGGNCELSQANQDVVHNDVVVMGPTNLPATVPYHASQMYAKNVATLLLHLFQDGQPNFDLSDEITTGTMMCTDGEITHPRLRQILEMPPLDAKTNLPDKEKASDQGQHEQNTEESGNETGDLATAETEPKESRQ